MVTVGENLAPSDISGSYCLGGHENLGPLASDAYTQIFIPESEGFKHPNHLNIQKTTFLSLVSPVLLIQWPYSIFSRLHQ